MDLDTFETAVLGLWSAHDVGKAIHPILCKGQIEGGLLQAIGWALQENLVMREGRVVNARLTDYVIPTILDAPRFTTILVEDPTRGGPAAARKGSARSRWTAGRPRSPRRSSTRPESSATACRSSPRTLWALSREAKR